MQNPATFKRVLISLSFLIIFTILGSAFYFVVTPEATCTDGKKNQAEKNIDCGGPCSPCKEILETKEITIEESAVVFGGNNTYDAIVKISNLNDSIGASSFKYVFNLKDSAGNIVATREGSTFILPADSRYVAELGFQVEGGTEPSKVEFIMSDIKWEKLGDAGKPQIGVYSKNFGRTSMGEGNKAEGVIRNESGYDLGKISIIVVLRDEDNKIVGVNKTEKNAVRTREERDFRLTLPYELAAPVRKMEVDTQSNVFDRQNLSFTL